MADPQTLASPDTSFDSAKKKKKKSKKRKAIDDAAATTEEETSKKRKTIDDTVFPTPTPEKKKKKESKKRKPIAAAEPESEPINVTVDASLTDATATPEKKKKKKSKNRKPTAEPEPEPINVTVDASLTDTTATPEKKKKKSKNRKPTAAEPEPINVTVDASLTGGSAAPAVAYFPSGYDPLAANSDSPSARLFRNTKYPSRVDLVVRSPGGGPDFVGRSYAGEAAMPQLCSYALGVLDKASGTLKVVPIAGDKILRLEPYIEAQKPAHSQHSGVTSEAGSAVPTGEMKVQDLTSMYGAKKDKDTDKKWMSLNEQRNDPSAYEDLDLGKPETNANNSDNAAVIIRNIPPYDPTADASERAYLFDEIIPKNLRSHLLEILSHLESGEFSSKGYGSFVSNRVHKLEKLQGEDKERLAWILSYITHLLTLFERNSSTSKQHRRKKEPTKAPAVPQAVYRNLLVMFIEEASSTLSTEKKELLINYILVLSLFADDFRSDPEDISADLKMTRKMLKPYYDQLGCKAVSTGAFKRSCMTLPAPLKFPKEVVRRRRRN